MQGKADKAAEEAAGYETRLAGLKTRVAVVTWMVGAHITLTVLAVGVVDHAPEPLTWVAQEQLP